MKQQIERLFPAGKQGAALLLAFILIGATLLRISDLDRTSLWYDEAVSWAQSKGSLIELLTAVAGDNYPPLHNLVLWLTMPVLGDSEWALRLPSALLGIAAVALMYPLGRLLAGRPAGLLAAALLAISPFHIWYSTEARMYSLLAAAGLFFLLTTLKSLQKPSPLWLGLLALSGALFLYSHIYALLGFAAVGLVCATFVLSDLLRNEPLKSSKAFLSCLAMGVSTLLFLPWLIILSMRARSVAEEGFWIAYPDLTFLKTLVFGISGSLFAFWLLVALSAFFVASVLVGRKRGRVEDNEQRRMLVCVAYTAGPAFLAYLYSILVQPILFDRYLIAAWPGLILLAAAGTQRLLPVLAPIALIAIISVLTYPPLSFTLFEKIRPEWRLIAQDYKSNRNTDDRLVLYKGFAAPALTYYLRDENAFTAARTDQKLQEFTGQGGWLLIVHSNEQETVAAKQVFGLSEAMPASQRFGWGASQLTLYAPP